MAVARVVSFIWYVFICCGSLNRHYIHRTRVVGVLYHFNFPLLCSRCCASPPGQFSGFDRIRHLRPHVFTRLRGTPAIELSFPHRVTWRFMQRTVDQHHTR